MRCRGHGGWGEAAVLCLCHTSIRPHVVSSVRIRHHWYAALHHEPRVSLRIPAEFDERIKSDESEYKAQKCNTRCWLIDISNLVSY